MAARILIVEDEQIIAADLANKLVKMGHDVVGVAITQAEAVSMAEEQRPDLVLVDVQLQGKMCGADAAQAIQQRVGAAVVFVTAFPSFFLREPANMLQPGICLGKPFSRTQLEAAVNAALASSNTVNSNTSVN